MRYMLILAGLLSSGCAFSPQLQRVAVGHNDVVANSNNELVLLNVLRARDREPLHFTSVSKLYGDAQLGGKATGNVAIRGGTPTEKTGSSGQLIETSTAAGTEVTTPGAEISVGAKSSIDVTVWDTQEFYQGITASIPAGTVAHYLHQGWPSDLITNLFISSVDFVASKDGPHYKKGSLVESFFNDPDVEGRFGSQFDAFVRCYRLTSVARSTDDAPLVPLAALEGKLALADLALLDGDKFDVTAPKDSAGNPQERWIKRKGKSGDSLALRTINADDGEGTCSPSNFVAEPSSLNRGGFEGQSDEHSIVATGLFRKNGQEIPVQVQIVLRSIDGVIYYLGEYLRSSNPPLLVTDAGQARLITVMATRPKNVFVSTRYKGQRYYVPATDQGRLTLESGRSSQVFALLQQLLNLQKSAKERPTTQTVRVVQ